MIIYAHRGNLNGAVPARENSPAYVDEALHAEFNVEVDLRCIGEELFLGHDYPIYPVTHAWLLARASGLLIHAKDLTTLSFLTACTQFHTQHHFFAHSSEPFTITSHKWIWLHDLSLPPDAHTIVPLIGAANVSKYPHKNMGGVCTDFPFSCTKMFNP